MADPIPSKKSRPKRGPRPNARAFQRANDNARFKRATLSTKAVKAKQDTPRRKATPEARPQLPIPPGAMASKSMPRVRELGIRGDNARRSFMPASFAGRQAGGAPAVKNVGTASTSTPRSAMKMPMPMPMPMSKTANPKMSIPKMPAGMTPIPVAAKAKGAGRLTAPGQLKKSAGVQSARQFTPAGAKAKR